MLRTWVVRLPAMKFTDSVRSFHVPETPGTSAWPPRMPSVPTSRATPVTCSAKRDSVSVIELIVSASAATSPLASTVTFSPRSPLATVALPAAIRRSWVVRLPAMTFTDSVRSFHVPATPGTSAWPPRMPSVPTSRATPVTCSAKLDSVSVIELIVSASAATSPLASTVILRVRSPLATAVVTCAIERTWPVRLPASWLTFSVRSRHVPSTPLTSAWPPRMPSVPTSRATRVTSSAKRDSWSTIVLMVSLSSRTSPRASTVIFLVRLPLATAVVTSAIWRTWVVRLPAMTFTESVRSFHVPETPLTFAWPPSLPSVPTSRATRVTSSAKDESWSTIVFTVVPMRANSPLTGWPSMVMAIFSERSPSATASITRATSVVGRTRSSMREFTLSTFSAHAPGTGPSEARSIIRPSRPITRETRASSRAMRALTSRSSLVRIWISPIRSRRRVRRRGLKSPSRAAVRAARISSNAWLSRPLPPTLSSAGVATAVPLAASVPAAARLGARGLVVRVAIPSSCGGAGRLPTSSGNRQNWLLRCSEGGRRADRLSEAAHALGDRTLAQRGVAEHEAGSRRRGADVELGEPGDGDVALGGRRDDRVLVGALGQQDDRVQAGGDAEDAGPGQLALQRVEQHAALGRVGRPRAAQVAVQRAAAQQLGEGELVERADAEVDAPAHLRHRPRPLARGDEPADAQRGREALRRRARIDDPLGVQALQRADRAAVVAELGVVVVLDDQPVGLARPREQLGAALGRHDVADGELMGRRGDHDARAAGDEGGDVDALLARRDRDGLQAGAAGERGQQREARVLEGDALVARLAQRVAEQAQPVGEAVGDGHAGRVRADRAHAGQIGGQLSPQRADAARVHVAQLGGGRVAQRALHRAQPHRAREGDEVGQAGHERVGRRARRRAQAGRLLADARAGAHARARPWTA